MGHRVGIAFAPFDSYQPSEVRRLIYAEGIGGSSGMQRCARRIQRHVDVSQIPYATTNGQPMMSVSTCGVSALTSIILPNDVSNSDKPTTALRERRRMEEHTIALNPRRRRAEGLTPSSGARFRQGPSPGRA